MQPSDTLAKAIRHDPSLAKVWDEANAIFNKAASSLVSAAQRLHALELEREDLKRRLAYLEAQQRDDELVASGRSRA